jgi:hypothetical protein
MVLTSAHETPGAFFGILFEARRVHLLLCFQRHCHITILASYNRYDKRYHPLSTSASLILVANAMGGHHPTPGRDKSAPTPWASLRSPFYGYFATNIEIAQEQQLHRNLQKNAVQWKEELCYLS